MRPFVVACVLGVVATSAVADDAAARKARAGQLVEEASAAEKNADYEAAIAKLRAAYDLVPHPDLLYNLGQAYRLAGQPWDAIDQYERYLAVEPKGRFASKARGFVTTLRAETAGKTRPAEVPTPVAAVPTPEPVMIAPAPLVMPEPPAAPSSDGGARATSAWRRPVAVGLGVAGAAGVGAGVYFGLRARSISDELSDHEGAWTDGLLAKQVEGDRAETRAIWSAAAGGALVLGGVVLYALDAKARGRAREVAVTPIVDGASVGVMVHGAL